MQPSASGLPGVRSLDLAVCISKPLPQRGEVSSERPDPPQGRAASSFAPGGDSGSFHLTFAAKQPEQFALGGDYPGRFCPEREAPDRFGGKSRVVCVG